MGGNALATVGVQSKRLNKSDFNNLTKKVVKVLDIAINKANKMGASIVSKPHEVKAYKQKETFGDLDLLVDKELFKYISYEDIMEMLKLEFNYEANLPFKEKDEKDMVFSLGLPSDEDGVFFQLDLIASDKEFYDFHSSYLNWNDLGNLVGVVASSNGFLKYGHDGLVYQFRDGDNLFKKVVLTTNWNTALDFFGYSKERYHEGFDTLEEIYEYAASSKFFTPDLYEFENRNHTQRTRDRKRPTYNGFLKWIEDRDSDGLFKTNIALSKEDWKKRVLEFFPWFEEREKYEWSKLQERKDFKKYFNGGILLKHKPDLVKVEISEYLKELEKSVPDLVSFVLENKEEAIEKLIKIKEKESPV